MLREEEEDESEESMDQRSLGRWAGRRRKVHNVEDDYVNDDGDDEEEEEALEGLTPPLPTGSRLSARGRRDPSWLHSRVKWVPCSEGGRDTS